MPQHATKTKAANLSPGLQRFDEAAAAKPCAFAELPVEAMLVAETYIQGAFG